MRFGRSTTSTPAKASRVASNVAPVVRSRSTQGDSKAVMIGLVNWIAVASASGIAITPMKKQTVATLDRRAAPELQPGPRQHEAAAAMTPGQDQSEADRAEAIAERRHAGAGPLPGHRFDDRVADREREEAGERDQESGPRAGGCRAHGPLSPAANDPGFAYRPVPMAENPPFPLLRRGWPRVRQLSKFPAYSPPYGRYPPHVRRGLRGVMSAFGRRNNASGNGSGGRASFGSAKPMKGGGFKKTVDMDGGEQFPPLEDVELPEADPMPLDGAPLDRHAKMAMLAERQTQSGEQASSKNEGFEASIHKIKEQVLPRLLERVDPEAAATLSKDELAEEFRPIIGEVLAELKINLNRREQFALEKVLVDELLGLGPLEELLNDVDVSDIMVNGPNQTYIEKEGQARARPDPVPRRGASAPDRPAHRQQGRPPSRPDHAARRRPPPGRQPRQRHHPAALAARHRHLDS